MTYQETRTRDKAIAVTLLIVGILCLAGAGYQGLYVEPHIRDQLKDQRELEISQYLDRIGAHFSNDSELTASERIEILKHDHLIHADDLGNIEVINKSYDEKLNATWDDQLPISLFVLGLGSLGSSALFSEIKFGGF